MDTLTEHDAVGISPGEINARSDVAEATVLAELGRFGEVTFGVARGRTSLWIVGSIGSRAVCALRAGFSLAPIENVGHSSTVEGAHVFEFVSSLGAIRAKVALRGGEFAAVRCTTTLLPTRDLIAHGWPHDLYPLDPQHGTVHTVQRGLRTGIVFASVQLPEPMSLFYLQDFSSLNDYFAAVRRSPADSIGGRWPELGYAPPGGEDRVLHEAREVVLSDAHLSLVPGVPENEGAAAGLYLDLLADTYLAIDRPEPQYHDWPQRAAQTLRDLSLSPDCTYVRDGRRFLMPYVGDSAKPPESMVQFTLAVNTGEYERWRGAPSALGAALRATVPAFFDATIGSIVRWLPEAVFSDTQAEQNMNHSAMDSWYLYHALFNLWRLANEGHAEAKGFFERSLPFAIRVARRFAYRWPIFFDLRSLDMIRAEAGPGKGGETDVGGIYALVMLHAYEMFHEAEYLHEAERGAESLRGLGFTLGYQLNTTGFAAEATLRLWKLTEKPQYLELSEICLANLFDNMWLWRCEYGYAAEYRPFFGLFPLRDAPYLAPYEELEAQGKFFDYLDLAGDALRPSLRLLLAEYQKYNLDRAWFFFPGSLPAGSLAPAPRNGRIERSLAVPLEDLQDGFERSGQVGQEIYGAGSAFVMTSRHFARLDDEDVLLFCSYPAYDPTRAPGSGTRSLSWRIGGDPRGTCEVRVIPGSADMPASDVTLRTRAGSIEVPLHGRLTPEGHAAFTVRGGSSLEIRLGERAAAEHAVRIGVPAVARR